MDYKSVYFNIINRAKTRTLVEYFEKHHIVPKSLGGLDNEGNLVKLTYREHFLVHWLLTKVCVGRARLKMQFALGSMRRCLVDRSKKITPWQFSVAKKAASRRKGISTGFKHSVENKKSISSKFAGIPKSKEHKLKLRKKKPEGFGLNLRKKKPEGFGAKISLARKGKRWTKAQYTVRGLVMPPQMVPF